MKIRLILKARAGLTPKKVTVTKKGKTFQQTVYVRVGEESKKEKSADGKILAKEYVDEMVNESPYYADMEKEEAINIGKKGISAMRKEMSSLMNTTGTIRSIHDVIEENHPNLSAVQLKHATRASYDYMLKKEIDAWKKGMKKLQKPVKKKKEFSAEELKEAVKTPEGAKALAAKLRGEGAGSRLAAAFHNKRNDIENKIEKTHTTEFKKEVISIVKKGTDRDIAETMAQNKLADKYRNEIDAKVLKQVVIK